MVTQDLWRSAPLNICFHSSINDAKKVKTTPDYPILQDLNIPRLFLLSPRTSSALHFGKIIDPQTRLKNLSPLLPQCAFILDTFEGIKIWTEHVSLSIVQCFK
jgi:hypothetical protein